jgi:calcineurin-like phosphoesterase family protein
MDAKKYFGKTPYKPLVVDENLIQRYENVYFTSDTHFGHRNMIKGMSNWTEGANREFKTVQEMDDAIIKSIMHTVGRDSLLIHLGDLTYPNTKLGSTIQYLSALHCDILLVRGNHDPQFERQQSIEWVTGQLMLSNNHSLIGVEDTAVVVIEDHTFFLSHYPHLVWPGHHRGVIHLHGHCHGGLNVPGYYTRKVKDMFWDLTQRPVSYKEIVESVKDNIILKVDHHG